MLFPAGFDFQVNGFRIAGSPVGTVEFMKEFAEKRLAEAVGKLQAIKSLGSKNARATHRLLVTSGTKLLNFLATTTPPTMLPVLQRFDKYVDAAFFATLEPGGFTYSGERLERATTCVSPCTPRMCVVSSVAACLSDPLFFELRHSIRKHMEPALSQLLGAIGGEGSKYWTLVSQVLTNSLELSPRPTCCVLTHTNAGRIFALLPCCVSLYLSFLPMNNI